MMKFRLTPLALAVTLVCCVRPAFSQAPASPPPVRFLDPAAISQRALPNGVRAIVQENPGADLVSVQVWVRAGSRYETKTDNGVTHLIESIAANSARSTPGGNIVPREAIEKLGGQLGSLTARDSMFYSATVASRFLPQALRILAAMTLAPDLSDDNIQSTKETLLNEMLMPGDPIREASDLAYVTAFATHPYQNAAQGTPAGLVALDAGQIRAYHKARFAGSNISVVAAGDLAAANAHKLIAQYFGSAPKAAAAPKFAEEKPPAQIQYASKRGGLPITVVSLAFRSPGIKKVEDVVATDVLLAYWKEGRDAAMGKVLRTASPQEGDADEDDAPPAPPADNDDENAPLAYGYDVDYLTQQDSGLFLIALAAPLNRAAATNAVLQEIARVQADGLSDAGLAHAKEMLRHQYLRQGETLSGQAGSLGFYDAIDSYRFAIDYLDRIEHVTNDDIKRVATQYLNVKAHVQATIEGVRPPVDKPNSGVITARLF